MPLLFPTHVTEETIAGLHFELETVADFEQVFDHYVRTTPNTVDRIPYYAHLWPAARALVTWMAERRDQWAGKSVLELGCGLGLPSITAARLGARVYACDFHPDNGAFLVRNAKRNGVRIQVMTMDWGRPALRAGFDLVLGSDLVYEKPMIAPLFHGVSRLLAPGGCFVLADPGRPTFDEAVAYGEQSGFLSEVHAEDDGFVVSFAMPAADRK